jgi:hypothetical protein
MRHDVLAALSAVLLLMTTTASADERAAPADLMTKKQMRAFEARSLEPPQTDPLPGLSDAELDERATYLEAELARNAHETRIWYGAVTTAYAAGVVVEADLALDTRSRPAIADYTVGAVKATIGVVGRLARPPRCVFGPTPGELVPGQDRASRAQRVLVAESLLRVDAKENDHRYSPLSHSLNVGLNVIGMLIIGLGYHDWARAGESVAVGLAFGELTIWTQPWHAKAAWKRYVRTRGLALDSTAGTHPDLGRQVSIRAAGPSFGFSF